MAAEQTNFVGSAPLGSFSIATATQPANNPGAASVQPFSIATTRYPIEYGGTAGGGGPTVFTYYRMRARDLHSVGVVYRHWIVTGEPDLDASSYTGPFDGGFKNFGDISVTDTFEQ